MTGASSGIGRQVALDLAARGETVVRLHGEPLLRELEVQLRGRSAASRTIVCDVADVGSFEQVLADVEREHGRIDILVNNAGTEQPTSAEDGFCDAYRRIMEVNYFALAAGTLAVLPDARAAWRHHRERLVRHGGASWTARGAAYAASKAAVAAFSESLAHEVAGRGVHLHVLYPAWVPTAMGMAGIGEAHSMPPKPVRRTEEQVAALLLKRMGGPRMEINAAVAPPRTHRTLAPRAYQRSMRQRFEPPTPSS